MNNKKLFAKNSLSGVIQKILIAILTFVTIPVFMRLLGVELFGIFAIISTIGDLSRLTNVGFHIALIKFLSRQGKTKESSQDIIVAFSSMLLIMGLLVIVLLFFNNYIILNIFNVDPEYLASSRILFNCLVFANAFLFLGMPFSAMLESQRLIYKVNLLQFVNSVIYWALILLFVSLGGGLEWVGLAILVAALVWFGLSVLLALKSWGKLEFDGIRSYYKQSIRKQLGYGLKVYLSGMLGLFTEPLTKILIANYFGVTYVGFLDIGLRVRNQFTRVLKSGIWPLFQYFSEISDKLRAAKLVKDIQEKLFIALLPVSVALLYMALPLVTIWIGEDIITISNILLVVSIGSLLGQLSQEPISIYLGVHQPLRLFFNQIFMIISLALPIFLFHEVLGFKVVYLSFIISYIVSFSHMLYCQKYLLGNLMFNTLPGLTKLILFIITLLAAGYLVSLLKLQPIIVLIITPFYMSLIAYVFIRQFRMVRKADVYLYLDENSTLTKRLARLFKE